MSQTIARTTEVCQKSSAIRTISSCVEIHDQLHVTGLIFWVLGCHAILHALAVDAFDDALMHEALTLCLSNGIEDDSMADLLSNLKGLILK